MAVGSKGLLILHFNDVYDVSEGRAARFVHMVRSLECDNPLVLFSGDCFSPSLMSVVTKGEQMPPVLNAVGVRAAVFGNHEFDWGTARCEELCAQCDFPWLMSNCSWKEGGAPLGGGRRSLILEHGGVKVGLMGLIEREWLATLSTIAEEELEWEDYVPAAKRLAAELRAAGAEVVVALTHMRLPNDQRLAAEAASDLDLILAGHDHDFGHVDAEGAAPIYKSGTDFRELSAISLSISPSAEGGGEAAARPRVAVASARRVAVAADGEADAATAAEVARFEDSVGREMEATVGRTDVPLDARFGTIRSRESNVGNWVADVLRLGTGAQLTLLNAGTLRADRVLGPGRLTLRDVTSLLPMADETAVLKLGGAQVLAALENGVSAYPRLEGRWPCVSGLTFAFDPAQPPGNRVVRGSVVVTSGEEGPAPLELEASYRVATKAYLAQGKDGYGAFVGAPLVLEPDEAPLLPGLVRNTFAELASYAAGAAEPGVFSPAKRKQAAKVHGPPACTPPKAAAEPDAKENDAANLATPQRPRAPPPEEACGICPAVEGRIVNVAGSPLRAHRTSRSSEPRASKIRQTYG